MRLVIMLLIAGVSVGQSIVMARKKEIPTVKMVAHKLARACFYVLRDKVKFDVQKAFM
jgi:hypothetical protein